MKHLSKVRSTVRHSYLYQLMFIKDFTQLQYETINLNVKVCNANYKFYRRLEKRVISKD